MKTFFSDLFAPISQWHEMIVTISHDHTFFLVASYKFSEKVLLSMIKADCPWTIVPLCILVSLHFPISFSSHCRWTKK